MLRDALSATVHSVIAVLEVGETEPGRRLQDVGGFTRAWVVY
ncbi:MAG: hypothetical protein ACI92E_000407 [Oceanicoccus sp.]|jgi:hypothetical protein